MQSFLQRLLALLLPVLSATAETARFEKAVPVWVTGRQKEVNLTVAFRATLNLPEPADLTLRLTASCDYRASVNGAFLGHGPCVAAEGWCRIDEHPLKPLLKSGANLIAIEVAGYNTGSYYLLNQPSFLQAEIVDAAGKVLASTTPSGEHRFTASIPGQRLQTSPKFSFQRPQAEDYRLSPGFRDWMTNPASPFKEEPLEPTGEKKLLSRGVAYPDYTVRKPVETLPDGIHGFECNSTGFIGATLEAKTPAVVTFSWDEILSDGKVNSGRINSRATIRYELEPGRYPVESFEPYTLRYLRIHVESGSCTVTDPYLRQYVNSDVSRAAFRSSDPGLNRIFQAAVETHLQNALDIFMDCPSRERAGWLCDSFFAARVASDLSGNTRIERNFFENYLLPESFPDLPAGMLPMCYPANHPDRNFIPNWAMWFVLELEEYRARSGDEAMVRALEPKTTALLEYFKRFENSDGLLEKLEKWVFIEWSAANGFTQDVNYPTNMLYAATLDSAARLYQRPELAAKAERVREAVRRQSFDGAFFIDNAVRDKATGKLVPQAKNRSEVCQYYAFYFGTATPESHLALWKSLVTEFGPKRDAKAVHPEVPPANVFVGHYLRMELLARHGLTDQLTREARDLFLPMTDLTGTLWESMGNRGFSCSHGFAAHVAHVFYRDLLGLRVTDAPAKKAVVRFGNVPLESCEGTLPVGNETIRLKWARKDGRIAYTLHAPAGWKIDVENPSGLPLDRAD